MSSNFKLDVRDGEGLSYAIDRALDAEFGKDVSITKRSQWQSIFNIITSNEQAEQTQEGQKQFDKTKDKDVSNYAQYKVRKGSYLLTNDTWNKIVKFVEGLGYTKAENASDKADEVATEETKPEGENTYISDEVNISEETKEKVAEILAEAEIDTKDLDMEAIYKKYTELAAQNNLDRAIIAKRVVNSAILQRKESFDDAEARFMNVYKSNQTPQDDVEDLRDNTIKYVNPYTNDAKEAKNGEKVKEGLHEFSRERILKYDADNDNKVSFDEFSAKEKGKGLEEIDDANLQLCFDYLDVNSDKFLDEQEIASYYYAMSRFSDEGDEITTEDITYREWMGAQEALDLVGEENLNDNQKKILEKFTNLRNDGYKNL